jgi:hypothetical protein
MTIIIPAVKMYDTYYRAIRRAGTTSVQDRKFTGRTPDRGGV